MDRGPLTDLADQITSIHGQLALVAVCVAVLLTLLILSPLGRVSGGHMNPAITLAMWRYRVFPGGGVAYYVAAQLVGSVLGCSQDAWSGVLSSPIRPWTSESFSPRKGGRSSNSSSLKR